MSVRQRRYSKEELAHRGQQLYESGIRQQVETGNEGKVVAIDIETGDFEVDETVMGATSGDQILLAYDSESAEGKAVARMNQSSPPPETDASQDWEDWEQECGFITYGEVGREIDDEALKERLRKRGFQV
jgi:hypothetical protein